MIVKNALTKVGGKAADKLAKAAVLSPEQLKDVEDKRNKYLSEMPNMNDEKAEELTSRLIAASCTEVYHSYLKQLTEYYTPVKKDFEYDKDFSTAHNIRYFNITKWVTDKKENNIEKLVNVYEVLSNANCNIALIFNRTLNKTNVYLATVNLDNSSNNTDVENYIKRLSSAIEGNFPGTEISNNEVGVLKCLDDVEHYSVACASNIPAEKSEKFLNQTIDKLIDGIIPERINQEYTIVLLATPVNDIDNRKVHLAELYSGLAPYAGWETSFTFTESNTNSSSATFGVNVGASAGIQNGQNTSTGVSQGQTDSNNQTETDSNSRGETNTQGTSETDSEGTTETSSSGGSETHSEGESSSEGSNSTKNMLERTLNSAKGGKTGTNESTSINSSDSHASTWTESMAKNISKSVTNSASRAVSNTVGKSISNSLGKAVTNTVTSTKGLYKGINLGANVGANFARSSNVSATVGKNEGIVQHFINYNIKHLLENLEYQMKRLEQSTALGMWDFAAYVLSEDQNIANNVAHSYIALTQGEKSYISNTAVNIWRGDSIGPKSDEAKEICSYIRELRHPVFALDPNLTEEIPICNVYPAVVTPTTSLSGKELAYSLNFPKKSIAGLPIINCTEFGRDIVSYGIDKSLNTINIGKIFHMNHAEKNRVNLSLQSLTSHTFITGSTGSGKSNTVYKIIDECLNNDVKFMVIEPAKGEYKNIFGNEEDVTVYGTNPKISKLLRINPFSFEENVHIYEHMDRLVEIFNVCWPMYAAMPAVLKNAIEKSYVDCGWDLLKSVNEFGKNYYPTFADVARNIKEIIESSEYDTENKGAYKGSLLTRLESLSNGINGLVFSTDEVSSRDLFDENVIVDLSRVGSSETKSLLMGMLVLKLQEYRMSYADSINGKLKHITVMEEAHNILKRTSTEQPVEGGNLAGKSVEMISNAIAEMRTYGEGFVIVDQSPGLMDMSVIRNTNTKIIMRLPDQTDRELVGKAANLNEEQIKEVAKIPCGVGAIYQNEWIQPILCLVDLKTTQESIYKYTNNEEEADKDSIENKLYIAELLSKGMKIGKDVSESEVFTKLSACGVSDYIKVLVTKILYNPPKEPNMEEFAPIMSALFPNVKESIKKAYRNEADVTEWTREANEIVIKYNVEDQLRRDIIQGSITYYLMNDLNNKKSLEHWIQEGGLR